MSGGRLIILLASIALTHQAARLHCCLQSSFSSFTWSFGPFACSAGALRELYAQVPAETSRHRYGGKSIPSRIASLPPKTAPGVTIIRPLCGLDNNLYNALEAAMKLDYPKYQVLFALQDEQDEALPVVHMIMDKYPNVEAQVIIGKSKPLG